MGLWPGIVPDRLYFVAAAQSDELFEDDPRRLTTGGGLFCEGERAVKSHTEHLTFNVPKRMDFVNITPQVEAAVKKSGVREGLCLVNTCHI
jgi:hypothetical protein